MEIKLAELKQRHIEAFTLEAPRGEGAKDMPVALYQGNVVRAAVKAGWFIIPALAPEGVGELDHSEVVELFEAAMKRYSEVMGVPPS
jgi:hypothetical protein